MIDSALIDKEYLVMLVACLCADRAIAINDMAVNSISKLLRMFFEVLVWNFGWNCLILYVLHIFYNILVGYIVCLFNPRLEP